MFMNATLAPVAAIEHLAILGGDRHDDLGDVVAIDKRLDRAQPDGPAIELGIDLLLLRVAEPRRLARGRQDHGELALAHGTPLLPGAAVLDQPRF